LDGSQQAVDQGLITQAQADALRDRQRFVSRGGFLIRLG